MRNALTVDVEEYFHPAEVQKAVDPGRWKQLPSRIEGQVAEVLELLAERQVKATFFILGWVAENHPRAIREIAAAGHEIACHSYAHRLVYGMRPEEFRQDTQRAVAAIQDACGTTPQAYRAPSYSITRESLWALEVLVECGFARDSSIYPIAHDRYGIPGSQRHAHILQTPSGPIHEIPPGTVRLFGGRVAPVGGGGYLRLLPYRYTAAGVRRVNREDRQPACLYFHPWEIDPDQPRLAVGRLAALRTYRGLASMRRKLRKLLAEFQFGSMQEVYGGLNLGLTAPSMGSGAAR